MTPMYIEKIREKLKSDYTHLKDSYAVKSLELFGSYARGEEKEESDIDILVEFTKPIDLFIFMELEERLSDLLGAKVDLVMRDTLKPRIRDRIIKEAVSL